MTKLYFVQELQVVEDPLQGESHALGAVVSLRGHFVHVPAEAVGEEQDL